MDTKLGTFTHEFNVDVIKSMEEGEWICEGYAMTPDLDNQDDIISSEAYDFAAKTLNDYPTVLFNHHDDIPVGRVLSAYKDEAGLRVKVLVSKTRPKLWKKIQEGVISKFSIRGRILKADRLWREDLQKFIRKILVISLHELSLVSVPANSNAKVIGSFIQKALNSYEWPEEPMSQENQEVTKSVVTATIESVVQEVAKTLVVEAPPAVKEIIAPVLTNPTEVEKSVLADVRSLLEVIKSNSSIKDLQNLLTAYEKGFEDSYQARVNRNLAISKSLYVLDNLKDVDGKEKVIVKQARALLKSLLSDNNYAMTLEDIATLGNKDITEYLKSIDSCIGQTDNTQINEILASIKAFFTGEVLRKSLEPLIVKQLNPELHNVNEKLKEIEKKLEQAEVKVEPSVKKSLDGQETLSNKPKANVFQGVFDHIITQIN